MKNKQRAKGVTPTPDFECSRYECIKCLSPMLKTLERLGIAIEEHKYLEPYELRMSMIAKGAKEPEINALVLSKYQIPPKKFKEVVRRFREQIELAPL